MENTEVTFNYLTLKNNTANCGGAAIVNNANLTLNYCHFERNTAFDVGGAIYNGVDGVLSVKQCSFAGNRAPKGGDIIYSYGQILIADCVFDDYNGNRDIISLSSTTSYIKNCTFKGIQEGGGGYRGGSNIENIGNLVIDNCTFSGVETNTRFGMISNSQVDLSLYSMIASGNVVSTSLRECNLLIINCIFNENTNRNFQSLITNCFGANLTIANSIFTKNQTQLPVPYSNYTYYPEWKHHGIISNLDLVGYRYNLCGSSKMTIINSTIANNIGTGVYSNGEIRMYNSIVYNNIPEEEILLPDRYDLYVTGFWDRQDFSNNLIGEDPLFADAENGDYTLQEESPAIDAGNNDYLTAYEITKDLFGESRISNNIVDLGAYEFQQEISSVYTITFSGEEIDIEQQSIEKDSYATRPENPERTGFDFGGWFTEETFENEWNFENNIVTQDTTLFAKWNIKTGITETSAVAKTITGYYSIIGQKLSKEPQKGIYIILYDNGTSEKVIVK